MHSHTSLSLSQKVIEAKAGETVPSFAEDIVTKGDIVIPKEQKAAAADGDGIAVDGADGVERNDAADEEDVWYESEEPSCSICLCAYEAGDDICWSCNTRCTHAFHTECMSEWLQRHDDCPQCRQEYLKSEAECNAEDGGEEKVDGDSGDGISGGGGGGGGEGAIAVNSTNAATSHRARPMGLVGLRHSSNMTRPVDDDEGEMEDVDLERGDAGAAFSGSAGQYELPQWYRETLPGIGLRYSSAR